MIWSVESWDTIPTPLIIPISHSPHHTSTERGSLRPGALLRNASATIPRGNHRLTRGTNHPRNTQIPRYLGVSPDSARALSRSLNSQDRKSMAHRNTSTPPADVTR